MSNAVSSELKEILTEILTVFGSELFYLAGGTNLALKYNHRVSTDIDLFLFDNEDRNLEKFYLQKLQNTFKQRLIVKSITNNTLRLSIDSIKVDFLQRATIKNIIVEPEIFENSNWSLANTIDVAAMKISAIINRGTIKDFYDMALLLHHFTLSEIINSYKLKYKIESDNQVIKYLTDFHEANLESVSSIQIINFELQSWQEVKIFITNKVTLYLKENN